MPVVVGVLILVLVVVVFLINTYVRHRDQQRFQSKLRSLIDDPGSTAPAKLSPECNVVVQVTDEEVLVTNPGNDPQGVRWDDLQNVRIVTTDEGPMVADVFWVLQGTESRCVVPQGATGESELLKRLQELPGFQNEGIVDAMCSVTNQTFECWQR